MIKTTGILCVLFAMQMSVGFCQVTNTGATKMQLPSFERLSASPEVVDLGVAVKLAAPSFRVGEPIVLYGSYRIDRELIQKTNDEPLTWVLIMVTRQDSPMAFVKLAREKPNLAPIPAQRQETMSASVRRGGYFNLDLRDHLGLPNEPGDYWLTVSLGKYITERTSFRVR